MGHNSAGRRTWGQGGGGSTQPLLMEGHLRINTEIKTVITQFLIHFLYMYQNSLAPKEILKVFSISILQNKGLHFNFILLYF